MTKAEYAKRYRTRMKEMHRCIHCGTQDERTLAGLCYCKFCSKKQKLWYRENKLRKMNGRTEK